MARSTFGGTISDTAFAENTSGLLSLASTTLTFWSAKTGGTQHTSLLLNAVSVSSIPVGADGQVPEFQGPDGVTTMWADGGGDRVLMVARIDPGAVPSKSQLPANVKDFGALGDGSTNDTSAITAAHNTGRPLFFPPGTYRTTGLTATQANQVWDFAAGATLKLTNSANTSTLIVSAAGVTLNRPKVDGNRVNQSGGSGGITVTGADCTIVAPQVTATRGAGINGTASGLTVQGGKVSDFGSATGAGIFVQAASGATLTGVDISGTRVTTTDTNTHGIALHGFIDGSFAILGTLVAPRIRGVEVTLPAASTQICIEVWGGCPRSVIADAVTSGGYMGISVDHSSGSTVSNFSVFGPSAIGVELAASAYCAVGPGTVDGNAVLDIGVSLSTANTPAPHHNAVSGVVVHNWDSTNGRALQAISADHLSVSGGSVSGGRQPFIIQNSTELTVVGVAFDGQASAQDAVALDNVTGSRISGCTFDGLTRSGVFVYNGGGSHDVGPNRLAGGTPVQVGTSGSIGSGSVVRGGRGTTAGRPAAANLGVGGDWYDTTLSKPTWSDGTNYKDAAGTTV